MKCNQCDKDAKFQHEGINWCATDSFIGTMNTVSYTHLTLPTNREV